MASTMTSSPSNSGALHESLPNRCTRSAVVCECVTYLNLAALEATRATGAWQIDYPAHQYTLQDRS